MSSGRATRTVRGSTPQAHSRSAKRPSKPANAVDRLASEHVDIVKYKINGLPDDMTPEVYGALIEEAKKKGLRTAVHIFSCVRGPRTRRSKSRSPNLIGRPAIEYERLQRTMRQRSTTCLRSDTHKVAGTLERLKSGGQAFEMTTSLPQSFVSLLSMSDRTLSASPNAGPVLSSRIWLSIHERGGVELRRRY